jgi:predicted DNA-binding protein
MEVFMKPIKFFNFMLPYETYQELKRLSIESEKSIAEIVRHGINRILKNPSCKCEDVKNGK